MLCFCCCARYPARRARTAYEYSSSQLTISCAPTSVPPVLLPPAYTGFIKGTEQNRVKTLVNGMLFEAEVVSLTAEVSDQLVTYKRISETYK